MDAAGPDRIVCLQRLAKTVNQLDWTSFSGLVGLIVKGKVAVTFYCWELYSNGVIFVILLWIHL